jgi:protein CpxP
MKNVFLVFSILMTTVAIIAQDSLTNITPEKRAAQFVIELSKELNLTTDQSSKIEAIQLASIKKVDEIKANGTGKDKKEINKEARAVTKAANAEIKAMLTDEQKPKFDVWLEQKKEKMKNKTGEK